MQVKCLWRSYGRWLWPLWLLFYSMSMWHKLQVDQSIDLTSKKLPLSYAKSLGKVSIRSLAAFSGFWATEQACKSAEGEPSAAHHEIYRRHNASKHASQSLAERERDTLTHTHTHTRIHTCAPTRGCFRGSH